MIFNIVRPFDAEKLSIWSLNQNSGIDSTTLISLEASYFSRQGTRLELDSDYEKLSNLNMTEIYMVR